MLDLIRAGTIDGELGNDLCKIHLKQLRQIERRLKNGTKNKKLRELKKEYEKLIKQGISKRSYPCHKIRKQLRELGYYQQSKAWREKTRQARLANPHSDKRSEGVKKAAEARIAREGMVK